MAVNFFSFSLSIVSLSSRKSSFVPTKIIGVLGQWCRTSGYHYRDVFSKYTIYLVLIKEIVIFIYLTFARTFSNDAGFTKEKHIRNTSCKKKKNDMKYKFNEGIRKMLYIGTYTF